MKTRKLLWIDKVLGGFIAHCVNWLVRLIGLVYSKNHQLNGQYKSIAIAKYKGMGSILQITSLIKTLKVNYPEVLIVFITTAVNEEIVKILGLSHKMILLNDKGILNLLKSFPGFLLNIIKSKIDLFIDLELYSSFSSTITALSFARNRVGFYQRSENYRFGIYSHMMYYNVNAPVFQTYLQIARLVGCTTIITDQEKLSAVGFPLPDSLKSKRYILINPNASDLRLERRWPEEYFIELIEKLTTNYPDYSIYLTGSMNEEAYVLSIASHFKGNSTVVSLAGKTSLKELIAIIAHAVFFISNDTGPMHLAALLGQKTISLFGPCSPVHYGFHESLRIIYKRMYCSPCVHEFKIPPCNGNNMCMKSIRVEEVYCHCKAILEGDNSTSPNHLTHLRYTYNKDVAGFIER